MIEFNNLRINVKEENGYYIQIELKKADNSWAVVAGTGVYSNPSIWSTHKQAISEDPVVEWKKDKDNDIERYCGKYDDAKEDKNNNQIILTKKIGFHNITAVWKINDNNNISVNVCDKIDEEAKGKGYVGKVMSQIYFIPDGKVSRAFEPLEFAWLPNLHKEGNHVCGDHFFRSPVTAVASCGYYTALVPDLDILSAKRTLPHAMDLRCIDTIIESPRMSYGICPWEVDGHVFTKHTDANFEKIETDTLEYGFNLFIGEYESKKQVSIMINKYLWDRYGHKYFKDIRPQVLPFEEYGYKYTYKYEVQDSIRRVKINNKDCAGFKNTHRRGANFHAWENDLNVGYGMKYYGEKDGDDKLARDGDSIVNTVIQSPSNKGAFPCVYNFDEEQYEGSLFWTARSVDPYKGYDSAAMGVTAWWGLYYYQDLENNKDLLKKIIDYADFLITKQLENGALPTYFYPNLENGKQLLNSATTCLNGAVLAKVAKITGKERYKIAAEKAAVYVEKNIVPECMFNDFEAYYSCSPKPLYAIDYWTGIRPHCNLSVQWGCDQYLALYELTGEKKWLDIGEYLLSILSLYQQVWDTSLYDEYLYGGFGVMNTDGEYNDGRQGRFVSTYADYYKITGKPEYLERAVATCRAAFSLSDIKENHQNNINNLVLNETIHPNGASEGKAEAGQGYAPENIHHCIKDGSDGFKGTWTGLTWSTGGALAASAYLQKHFGDVWVDVKNKEIIPINGTYAKIILIENEKIVLNVKSALKELKSPYNKNMEVVVKFGGVNYKKMSVSFDGDVYKLYTTEELSNGIKILI